MSHTSALMMPRSNYDYNYQQSQDSERRKKEMIREFQRAEAQQRDDN